MSEENTVKQTHWLPKRQVQVQQGHNPTKLPFNALLIWGVYKVFFARCQGPWLCLLCSVKLQTHDWIIGVLLFHDNQLREYVDWNLCVIREYACLSCLALFRWQVQLPIKGDTLVRKVAWRVFSIKKKHKLFMKRQWCQKCFGTLESSWNDEIGKTIAQFLSLIGNCIYIIVYCIFI